MNGYKIMVVDDEPILRMDLKEMLQEEGYHVVAEGKNGEEAVDLVYRVKPDLVIMDVKMPKMNGIKASQIIRQISDSAVLLLTAFSQQDLVRDAREAGVMAYVVKPFSEEDLIPAVEMALGQRERMKRLKQELFQAEEKLKERKVIERAKGKVMDRFSCSEEQAYKWMRKQGMSRRIPLIQLAKRIVDGDWEKKI